MWTNIKSKRLRLIYLASIRKSLDTFFSNYIWLICNFRFNLVKILLDSDLVYHIYVNVVARKEDFEKILTFAGDALTYTQDLFYFPKLGLNKGFPFPFIKYYFLFII